MPLTRISAPAHLPLAHIQALAAATQEALIATCGVPRNDLFQLLTRFDSGHMILDPSFGGVNRSADACIVEITFLRGRTDDQKRQLFQHIVAGAQAHGFRPDDIMIALTENAHADWSLGLGVAYADHAHGARQA